MAPSGWSAAAAVAATTGPERPPRAPAPRASPTRAGHPIRSDGWALPPAVGACAERTRSAALGSSPAQCAGRAHRAPPMRSVHATAPCIPDLRGRVADRALPVTAATAHRGCPSRTTVKYLIRDRDSTYTAAFDASSSVGRGRLRSDCWRTARSDARPRAAGVPAQQGSRSSIGHHLARRNDGTTPPHAAAASLDRAQPSQRGRTLASTQAPAGSIPGPGTSGRLVRSAR
jgi:hypothetical protein